MVDSNLAVLLAERNLKITKVSRDTGISRTTLTALCYDQTAGIKYDTLNTLCKYLQITPTEFFSYTEYDYEIEFQGSLDTDDERIKCFDERIYGYDVNIIIKKSNMTWRYPVVALIAPGDKQMPLDNLSVAFIPYYAEDSDDATPMDLQAVREYHCMTHEMTKRQITSLKAQLRELISPSFVKEYMKDHECSKDDVLASDDSLIINISL